MSFHRARTPMRRQYQRLAIARAQAMKWRPAEPSDLPVFVGSVNQDFAGTATADWPVHANERRQTVTLETPLGEYRAHLRPGALKRDGETFAPISAGDVLHFEWRPA